MLAVNVIEVLRLGVVRLEVLVAQRPRGRNAVGVSDATEVLLAQAQQGGAVDLGVAADVILDPGMKGVAFLVGPRLLGPVLRLE